MSKRTIERSALRWGLKNWHRIGWALFGCYTLYSIHTLVADFETVGQRFLDWTQFMQNTVIDHDKPAAAPSMEPGTSS